MSVAELVFFRGEESLLRLRLDRAETCIGSDATNDVVVPDPNVPGLAALLIDRGAQRYRVRDFTGGLLRVSGARLEADELDLDHGDTIGLGPYGLRLQIRDEDASRPRAGRTAVLGHEARSAEGATITHAGRRHAIQIAAPFNIGGDEDNDLVLDDDFVSAFHCRIVFRDGRWYAIDLGSTNGTEVNGLKVREAELPPSAVLRLGRAEVEFSALEPTPEAAPANAPFHGMIGASEAMQRVFGLIRRVAPAREPVLVVGESGSGKELVAQALHEASPRRAKPYLALNCGALSSGVIEGELFGYMKGAFTGAQSDKAGAFEATDGGTLFLDEIGELPLDLQPKLLRVLESSCVRRVGGLREIRVETRVVAATHRNLEELVASGAFREDLFHRLFVLPIRIPPLRERPADILPLARHFLAAKAGDRTLTLAKDAEAAILAHTWPGNIRELKNVLVRAILMTDGDVIRASDLEFSRDAFSRAAREPRSAVRAHEQDERERMVRALADAEGNRAEAARLVGVSKSTFHDRMKRYGIVVK